MLCQLVLLVLLSSLQPGRLQAEGTDVRIMLQNIDRNIVHLNSMIRSYVKWSEECKAQIEDSTLSLRANLSSLNDSVNYLTHQLEAIQSNVEQLPAYTCGGTGGWRHVVYMNMTHPNIFTYSTVQVYCNNETGRTEYRSCGDANLFGLPSGTYTIRPSGGSPVTVYCDMDMKECGGGVWTRVASYNYSDPSTSCPGDWSLITSPIRSCGRDSPLPACASAAFPTNNIDFSSVCGRVIAIQYGSPSAFYSYHHRNRSIVSYYVDGVSITHGNPRQHVWTFAGYPSDSFTRSSELCPCSQPSRNVPSPPPFVGNNYFCDTAATTSWSSIYHRDDPLWDGQGCGGPSTCCSLNNPPWFSTTLPNTTSDDIEVRICDNERSSIDDTPITTLDLYIQ